MTDLFPVSFLPSKVGWTKGLKHPKDKLLKANGIHLWRLSLLVLSLELVSKGKLSSLLLQLGELILVFGHLLESGLDKLALHV